MTEAEAWGYSQYNEYNRFQNLDGIEPKIIQHLIKSETKYADYFWKILKYNTIDALTCDTVSKAERMKLVCTNNGETEGKRLFLTPRDDNSQGDQCSSVYIYLGEIIPVDNTRAIVGVTVETCVYTKIGVISGDYDEDLNDQSNPNDGDEQGSIVVPYKNRETVLLKCILAELNGLYIDGIGYMALQTFNAGSTVGGLIKHSLRGSSDQNHGHTITLRLEISGVSGDASCGY